MFFLCFNMSHVFFFSPPSPLQLLRAVPSDRVTSRSRCSATFRGHAHGHVSRILRNDEETRDLERGEKTHAHTHTHSEALLCTHWTPNPIGRAPRCLATAVDCAGPQATLTFVRQMSPDRCFQCVSAHGCMCKNKQFMYDFTVSSVRFAWQFSARVIRIARLKASTRGHAYSKYEYAYPAPNLY